ncbi:MAG: DUF1847 domain-containing protein [Desulfarculales bacterium]|jgi:uncharacterized metal-binding protein|nr:DUF1847 domain-containing protein [Desulfarculales bacterium]
MEKAKPVPGCGHCDIPGKEQRCRTGRGKAPANCPTVHYRDMAQDVFDSFLPQEKEFLRQSAFQERDGYYWRPDFCDTMPVKPRIVEIVEFARRMRYKKLGFIFCGGLRAEASVVQEILETNSFLVVSAACKVGRQPKSSFGVPREMQLNPLQEEETICNPKLQAMIMNEAQVDFNIMMGLCVGHDSVALKNLEAPVSILAVKDRVTGHNPLMPVYLYDSYYAYLKKALP